MWILVQEREYLQRRLGHATEDYRSQSSLNYNPASQMVLSGNVMSHNIPTLEDLYHFRGKWTG
jgi:hypothetical protein